MVLKAHLLVTTLQSVAQEHATKVLNISPAAPHQLLGLGWDSFRVLNLMCWFLRFAEPVFSYKPCSCNSAELPFHVRYALISWNMISLLTSI